MFWFLYPLSWERRDDDVVEFCGLRQRPYITADMLTRLKESFHNRTVDALTGPLVHTLLTVKIRVCLSEHIFKSPIENGYANREKAFLGVEG